MIFNIQALRAVAALLVVCVHMAVFARLLGGGERTRAFGNCGVDLFFVISGFIMMHGVMAQRISASGFLVNRLIRVLPLYWLTTLAVFTIAVAAPHLMGDTRADLSQLALSLVFIPFDRGAGIVQPLFFLGWTLNYEMFFYASFALGLAATRGRPVPTMLFCAGLLLICVTVGRVMPVRGVLATFYTADIMLEFLFGMVAAWLLARVRAPARLGLAMTSLGLALLVAFWATGIGAAFHIPRPVIAGLPAMLTVIGALWAERGGLRVAARSVQAIGAASYALYLSHPFVMQVFGKLATRIDRPAITILLAMLGLAGVVMVALLVHRIVELPLTDRLRRAVGHRRPLAERADPLAEKKGDRQLAPR